MDGEGGVACLGLVNGGGGGGSWGGGAGYLM